MGIRPENIRIVQRDQADLTAELEMISNMGAERYIHAKTDDMSLAIRCVEEIQLEPGEKIPLELDGSKVHLFHEGRRV